MCVWVEWWATLWVVVGATDKTSSSGDWLFYCSGETAQADYLRLLALLVAYIGIPVTRDQYPREPSKSMPFDRLTP